MESPLEAGPARGRQLEEIFEHVEQAQEAIVLGDFNFGDGEDEESHLDPACMKSNATSPIGPRRT